MQKCLIPAGESRLRRTIPAILLGLALSYAGILAMAWNMGVWLAQPDGQPLAADFIAFWAAGKLALQGHAAAAYDWTIHKEIAMSQAGTTFGGFFSWQYPPTFLLAMPALALMPYPVAFLAWMGAGLALYLLAIRLIAGDWRGSVAALAWPAVLWNLVVGQNGLLSAALLGGGLALVEKRPALAGILFGLLTFKPQFGLLIPVALVAGRCWRVIGWAALATAVQIGLSLLVLGPQAWLAFLDQALAINASILGNGSTGFAKLQSAYGYARALGASANLAWSIHALLVACLCAFVARLWRADGGFDTKAAALASATILASPYAFTYDFVALAIPLAFLARAGFSGREMIVVGVAGLLVACGPVAHVAPCLGATLLILAMTVGRAKNFAVDANRLRSAGAA